MGINERCDQFFKILHQLDPNWCVDPSNNFNTRDFKSSEFQNYIKDKKEPINNLEKEFSTKKFKENGPKIRGLLSIFRIFNKCYIKSTNNRFNWNPNSFLHGSFGLGKPANSFFEGTHTFEKRIYPWLSGESPTYENWNGEVYFDLPGSNSRSAINDPYWLNIFREKSNGRGIVLTIGNKHVDNTVRLIRVLRALKNKYPIQILVDEDFSQESKHNIISAARDDFTELPKSYENVSDILGKNYLKPGESLPWQEIWFINVKNAIVPSYWNLFQGFTKKLLASIFNSFEEYMLLDSDSVILENPEFFFNIKEYQQTGAYFYKDRAWKARAKKSSNFLKTLGPNLIDSVVFDIPMMTNHTLDREIFKGFRHYMESGLVLLNKKQHFNSVLMSLQLSFFEPISSQFYGEKEYFWLGLAFNGDESYEFDPNFSASIGNFSDTNNPIKEVCSAHPAHLSAHDGHLLWLNSGFRFCHKAGIGKVKYDVEAGHNGRFPSNPHELKSIFESLFRPSHGIIPPWSLDMKGKNGQFLTGWNDEFKYCAGTMFCAVSSVGSIDKPILGQVITFDDTAKNLMSYYGEIWMG
ncbi:uncharacterized protein SPAPADRAFT_50813 [Spathaspora passalidarum NRRL Y-27907]|uniref:Alpha-1,3-mannosyltransferase n=1 Tax=Spathaspora passalidarum (strain NRRL Y-27907 / 11-Y1) TaxID=619300 RepID=G3APS2_SPAPN|nr:uncharacterized protein SPAPADRAFT_50813 [Spathaspora passalidarum NRRL Y-27907]EGW32243.1 hypothetical protein SPAPADRAFT_50813 [Spathaspora passalidarum NRRL Y-27907]